MEQHLDLKLVFWNIVSFSVLLVIIKYVIWPRIQFVVEARKLKIERLIKGYNKKSEELDQEFLEIRKLQKRTKEVSNKLMEESKKKGRLIREEIIQKAYNEANALVERSKSEIKRDREEELARLKENTSQIVVKAVTCILHEVIDEKMDKKINAKAKEIIKTIELS
jgi:F-type H+-transporting ATPase subunit b